MYSMFFYSVIVDLVVVVCLCRDGMWGGSGCPGDSNGMWCVRSSVHCTLVYQSTVTH